MPDISYGIGCWFKFFGKPYQHKFIFQCGGFDICLAENITQGDVSLVAALEVCCQCDALHNFCFGFVKGTHKTCQTAQICSLVNWLALVRCWANHWPIGAITSPHVT